MRSLFKPDINVVEDGGATVRLVAYESVVFSHWIPIRRQIERVGWGVRKNVIFDLSGTKLVDHSALQRTFELAMV